MPSAAEHLEHARQNGSRIIPFWEALVTLEEMLGDDDDDTSAPTLRLIRGGHDA